MKPTTARTAKILAILLLICCLAGAYRLLTHTGMLFAGRVLVEQAGADPILLNGEPLGDGWLALPEQILLTAPGDIPQAARTGIACMGLLRFLPCLAALVLSALMLVNVLRGRLFGATNARLLRAAGITVAAAAILLPVLNGYAIPALIRAASGIGVGVGMDHSRSPQLWQGLALLLAAHALRAGGEEAQQQG